MVPEPGIDETVAILQGVGPAYASYHNVTYCEEAYAAAARFSS